MHSLFEPQLHDDVEHEVEQQIHDEDGQQETAEAGRLFDHAQNAAKNEVKLTIIK